MDKKKLFQNAEWYIVLAMLAFCGLLAWQISIIKVEESRMLPTFALVIMLASAVAVLIPLLQGKTGFRPIKDAIPNLKEACVLLMLAVSCMLYKTFGFYATVFLILIGITLLLQPTPLTLKKVLSGLLYDAALMIVIYICFAYLLELVTPTGILP